MILDRLLARAGVDPLQWRALVVAGLKLDFRAPGLSEGGASGVQRLLAIAAMNLVLGIGLAMLALYVPDVFVSGSLVLTVTMFMVAVSVVMEFAVVVISPLDYDVLGYQPVSSPTYLAARLTNVLFYTTLITTTIALLPMFAFFFARGFNPILGLAAMLAVYLGCVATTLAMVALYVATARVVHPQRLRRALTYVQLVTSFSIYGGYFLLSRVFEPAALRAWAVAKRPAMLLYPPTWFASYLELATGRWSPMEVIPALASVVTLAALLWVVMRRLSLNYSATLSSQAARSEGTRRRRGGASLVFESGERRAVALLVRAQFRSDQRFRLGVLSMLPLSVFYLLVAFKDGPVVDPFLPEGRAGSDGLLMYFAVLFLPMMLQMSISRSDSFRAAWVFHVTPARRADLVLAARDVTVLYLLAPYLVLLAALLSYLFGNPLHAFGHMLFQGLIANLFLLAIVAIQPDLPFSRPVQKGHFTAGFFGVVIVGSIVQPLSSLLLARTIYPSRVLVMLTAGVLVLAAAAGQVWLRRRLQRQSAKVEFLD